MISWNAHTLLVSEQAFDDLGSSSIKYNVSSIFRWTVPSCYKPFSTLVCYQHLQYIFFSAFSSLSDKFVHNYVFSKRFPEYAALLSKEFWMLCDCAGKPFLRFLWKNRILLLHPNNGRTVMNQAKTLITLYWNNLPDFQNESACVCAQYKAVLVSTHFFLKA